MQDFNVDILQRELGELPLVLSRVFAAAVAERLSDSGAKFFHDTAPTMRGALRSALDALWAWRGERDGKMEFQNVHLPNCMEALNRAATVAQSRGEFPLTGLQRRLLTVRGTDAVHVASDAATDEAFFAENFAGAVAYGLLGVIQEDSSQFAWAAQRAYDSVDRYVLSVERDAAQHWNEDEVLAHPVIQRELLRQRHDLQSLRRAGLSDDSVAAFIENARRRAVIEASSVLSPSIVDT